MPGSLIGESRLNQFLCYIRQWVQVPGVWHSLFKAAFECVAGREVVHGVLLTPLAERQWAAQGCC